MRRRRFLAVAGGTAAGAAVIGAGWPLATDLVIPGEPGRVLPSRAPLPRPYQVRLPVPSRLEGPRAEITQRLARLRILPGLTTEAWTYNGTFPGPTIVSRANEPTVVRHRNELAEAVVVHLHGGHTPPSDDGYPTDLVRPGHTRAYRYPLRQRAATLWYHDHRMGFTGPALWRGLAGFHLVHDDTEDSLPLPRGSRDIPLMIADRSFDADGAFRFPLARPYPMSGGRGNADMSHSEMTGTAAPTVTSPYMNGVLGDVILVNGTPWPACTVDPARYRLRLLNASNARRYRLELDPQPPGGGALVQIGSDGGLLARPVRHDTIDIASAERFDVIVDFSRYPHGSRIRLVNRLGDGTTTDVMCFDITGSDRTDDSAVPARLADVPALPTANAPRRTFFFRQSSSGTWTINGEPFRPHDALVSPRLGQVEVWRFVTELSHPVHVHLNPFQVLSRDDGPPGPYDAGWKDTVDVHPAEAVEVAIRFSGYAGHYLVHCHNLEHEDMAMMADFATQA